MEDTALYTLLLGIQPPWRVTRVEVALAAERIDVWVEEAPGTLFPCAVCAPPAPVDHAAGGGAVAVHAGLRAPADRHAHGVRCDGGESPHGDELERGVGGPGAGRR